MKYTVYIMSNMRHGTIYIGMTSDINRRVYEHKNKTIDGFTKDYSLDKLIYIENYSDVNEAIKREKQIKAWKRSWKIQLIEKQNPSWIDFSKNLF